MSDDDALATIVRWHDSGGLVEVIARRRDSVTVSLRTCDGGEEMGVVTSADPAVRAWLDAHPSAG
ncbi:hypothetical protein AAFP30_17195 [Gordonia sp. CPCC 205515]|uniref:hypothetical protein n=1 Tax=Gordonia sp. CPCC 205515 TaxID=3140791 RepID=UPI003AF3D7BA